MAASDQTYRNQKTLDTVFGVSCALMLISLIWMFADDYNREWKKEQRVFRDVESLMSERFALDKMPNARELVAAERELDRATARLEKKQPELDEIKNSLDKLQAPIVSSDDRARTIKADLDSKKSFYDLEVEKKGPESARAEDLLKEIRDLQEEWEKAQAVADARKKDRDDLLRQQDDIEKPKKLAEARLKKLREDFDLQVKLAKQKKWTAGDWFRSLVILDAFNSPLRINQITLNDLPIDYSFKYVTRFDRCTTCHLGIDRPGYDKEALRGLANSSIGLQLEASDERIAKLDAEVRKRMSAKQDFKALARELNREGAYKEVLTDLAKDLGQKTLDLSEARVNEFCVHPRLDLFVDANSPHAMEKFGCTICHGGQGSATSFYYASHTPNNTAEQEKWEKTHGWKADHDWEFPMQPMRFVESQCLKCHHQVTDLIRQGNRNEAPKLVRGYNLVRELGCFGCHEIAGTKGGRAVGPDLRLEPIPSLDELTPAERVKALADPQNLPGTMRKVGPSLNRLSDKTHPGWVKRWIKSPRSFRPTTRMPHFYGLSNNDDSLPEDQKLFPDAEIEAITYYLFHESKAYIGNVDTDRKADFLKLLDIFRAAQRSARAQKLKKLEDALKATEQDRARLQALLSRKMPRDERAKKSWVADIKSLEAKLGLPAIADELLKDSVLNEQEKKELGEAVWRLNHRFQPLTLAEKLARSASGVNLPDAATQIKNGRRLFAEKGCLACHSHQAISRPEASLLPDLNDPTKPPAPVTLPGIKREIYFKDQPTFGPNLSMLAGKLGTDAAGKDYESKWRWLTQWILDPTFHSPRTLMPVTHLTYEEASAVASWLLNQKVEETDPDWSNVQVPEAKYGTLKELATLTLSKAMASDELDKLFKGKLSKGTMRSLSPDDRELAEMIVADRQGVTDAIRWYVGKKAIARMGCFGCHNIPGFDRAKPIGTALNDWGKKDPERLAFEDIEAFVKDKYEIVPSLTDERGRPLPFIREDGKWVTEHSGKSGYEEKFFAEALNHHQRSREGFLYQKLRDPRSYDYNRQRPWDERLRMPQFKFARTKPREAESADDYAFRKGMSTEAWKVKQYKPESAEELHARAAKEEADAREAAMTFVLGLLAEPIPMKFVYDPAPDRAAEVRGRQVLDKYNCSACHLVRDGIYDFKVTDELLKAFDDFPNRGDFANDYVFVNHNAWVGPAAGDRVTLHGLPQLYFDSEKNEKQVTLLLTQAFSYVNRKNEAKDKRAYDLVPLVRKDATIQAEPWGGHFADLLTSYFIKVFKAEKQFEAESKSFDEDHQDNQYARAAGPPSLLREGEKVQPNWLFQFLKNPTRIRPMARLRMPRFNMNDEEAHALVNYFAASAKVTNPGIGLTYPYVAVPEKDDDYLARRTREYTAALKKDKGQYERRLKEMSTLWREELESQIAAAKLLVKAAEVELKQKQDAAKKEEDEDKKKILEDDAAAAKKNLEAMEKRLAALRDGLAKLDFAGQRARWEAGETFVFDGFKLLTDKNFCLKCHQIGRLQADQALGGPPLNLAQDRLRPDWMMRWIANPQRFMTYKSIMPMNFPNNQPIKPEEQALFLGSALDRVIAARDMLMNFRKVEAIVGDRIPARPPPAGGGP
jgi:mono/diheme cytochrome c family protein